ncbi:MAG: Fe(3+) dicitrate transport protein [Paraglaciecola sp.]|jgi:Fe(3+) dicitrate transport protein
MNFKRNLLNSAIFSSLLIAPLCIHAEEDAKEVDEDPVEIEVFTVTGILPSRLNVIAGSFSIIDEAYLIKRRPLSNLERMRTVPGINIVADGSMGFDTNIGFRGQDPRRSAKAMIMEDGVPLQLAPYTDPVVHYTTPSSVVSRIEVIKGAGQVLHGPQTLGGAVNFVTKSVPRAGEIEGAVTTTFGNQDHRMLHGNLGVGGDAGGIMVDFTEVKGDGLFNDSDFAAKDYRIKAALDISKRQTIGIKLVYTNDRRNQTENYLTRDEYANDPFSHPTVELDLWEQDHEVAQFSHDFKVNKDFTLRSKAYYTDTFRNGLRGSNSGREVNGIFESRLRNCDAVGDVNGDGNLTISDLGDTDINICGGRHSPRQYYTWGVGSRADFTHNLFGFKNDAIVGVRYHEESAHRQRVFATNTAERKRYELALINDTNDTRKGIYLSAKAISYFAQNTIYAGDWSLTPGFRVEDVRSSDEDEFSGIKEESNFTEFLPSFGVAWNGIAKTTFFTGIHKGISPARADREFTDDGGRAESEKSTLFELGVRSGYFKGITASATLFHNDIENTVVDLGATFENSGQSKQQGIELAGRINFEDIYKTPNNFYLFGAYTNVWTAKYEKARDPEYDGNRMQYSPKYLLNLDFGYDHASGVDARIGVQHISEQFVDDENTRIENGRGIEGILPGYTVFNATINYSVVNTDVTLFASVENLFDKAYLASRNTGKLPGRERLLFAGITYDF